MVIITPKVLHLFPIFSFLLLLLLKFSLAATTYNVQSYGAKPDGKSDSTKPFLNAWAAACASGKPSTIYVPQGKYVLGTAQFWGHSCKNSITIRIDGTLVQPYDYHVTGHNAHWLSFERVNGVKIIGGTLDGQGAGLWSCKASGGNCPGGASTLGIYNSNNIVVSGLTSLNSQLFHVIVDGCNNVMIQGMKISASSNSPNTDGIHIQNSNGVTVLSSIIATGDDCISMGPGSSNVLIQSIFCGPGHGISIGSLGWNKQEPGVQNVTVKSVNFQGTQNGVRIKTWARPSNGFVKNVLFQDVTMGNVKNPIVIDQHYCPDHPNSCPNQASGVKISAVTFKQIRGRSASPVAISIGCSQNNPCRSITFQDISLTYGNQAARVACAYAGGSYHGFVQPRGCL
ncbi:OLC1v1007907C1 [Oldenlandia corymbosa var. corymbosa]|uniref:OLC1v1007907C1 n=1 Tax=Oldenlandia corymbosa var. corymbosa TaxID=529605 RepID=A0AAV1DKB0_OLDCO|nr:OLC1v1007907C1 [Oldenlandia corymbosa var. corymbosa]